MRRSILTAVITASLLLFFSYPASAYFTQADPVITGDYEDEILTVVMAKDFKRLEEIASELRSTKARFSGGCYKLPSFYSGVGILEKETDEAYVKRLGIIDEWIEQYPDSVTARVAKADVLTDFAWYARGGGYANTVTDQGWKLFYERLEQAYKLLMIEPVPGAEDCQMRYELRLLLGMVMGMRDSDYEKLFNDAVTFDPGYYGFYMRKTKKLLPRWGGSPGEWIRFADTSFDQNKNDEGMTMYTRIIWSAYLQKEWLPLRTDNGISWDKMKKGFLEIEKNYPDSEWNLNIFAAFAYMFGDTETLRGLLNRIGDEPRLEIWGSKEKYECAKDFAKYNTGLKGWWFLLIRKLFVAYMGIINYLRDIARWVYNFG